MTLPKPPFDRQSAKQIVQAVLEAWNSRNPSKVARFFSEESVWRNRREFIRGCEAIVSFLKRKWEKKLHYRLSKELLTHSENLISIRFESEWQHAESGKWFRSRGSELWEFDEDGYMSLRDVSERDIPISAGER